MNTITRYLLVFAVFGPSSPLLLAASFDCRKASSRVEQRICLNRELSELDEQLSSEYKGALKATANPSELRESQREWLERRNRCSDYARAPAEIDYCLKPKYQDRVTELRALRTPLERTFGVYTNRHPRCFLAPDPRNDSRNMSVCDGFHEDRIALQRDRNGAIWIEMRLFFFNGHICTFEGRAIWEEGKLVAGDREEFKDEPCTYSATS